MDRPDPHIPSPTPRLRVLASGSSGNCSILRAGRRTILIDAGISPRRTERHLEESGLTLDGLDAILLTHLDSDHFHSGWVRALPDHVRVFVHASHEREAFLRGVRRDCRRLFDDAVDLSDDIRVTATLTHHDALGTAAFRFAFPSGASLGFATDLGRTTDGLVDHLRAVDVLAVESNYCPRLQADSDRPWSLKRRVMGGRGHLSNEECVSLVADVGPRAHVVLLHLSRQCNDPRLVARLHAQRPYQVTITSQHAPTAWIDVRAGSHGGNGCAEPKGTTRPLVFGSLFDHLGAPERERAT